MPLLEPARNNSEVAACECATQDNPETSPRARWVVMRLLAWSAVRSPRQGRVNCFARTMRAD